MTPASTLLAGGLAAAMLVLGAGAASADPGQATASVNVRSGPGTGYRVIDTLYPGEDVDIRNCQGSWCYVVHTGPDGWVSASYLDSAGGYPSDNYGYDDDYGPPVYVNPPPVYITPPPVFVRPPYFHRPPPHFRPPHRPPPWHGGPGFPFPGRPHGADNPPAHVGNPGTPPPNVRAPGGNPPPTVRQHRRDGAGKPGDLCKTDPQLCENGPGRHRQH